jgi:biuret amidohydrolase
MTATNPSPIASGAVPCTVSGSEPYPWPWDGHLDPRRVALLVLGWDDVWAARCHSGAETTQRIAEISARSPFVVAVAHVPPRTLAGGRVPAPLDAPPGARAVTAGGIDGFHDGPLEGLLRAAGRDQLLLCGYGLEGPVHSTMRSANDRGHECLLVLDACAPVDPDLVAASRSMVLMSGGIFGAVGDCASTVSALDRTDRAALPGTAPPVPPSRDPGGPR